MSVEGRMGTWRFHNIFGLLWCLLKMNYLAKKHKEEVDIDLHFPMDWL